MREHKSQFDSEKLKEAKNHMKHAHKAMMESYKTLLPEGFIENRRKARVEFLTGIRSLVDMAFDHASEHGESDSE